MSRPKEYWICKGTSNFCSEMDWDLDNDKPMRSQPDGFYDIICMEDTVEGGINVIEKSAYDRVAEDLRVIVEKIYNGGAKNISHSDFVRAFKTLKDLGVI
jgi:hypothetical protein